VALPELMVLVDYFAAEMTDVVQSQLLHCSSRAATTVHSSHIIILYLLRIIIRKHESHMVGHCDVTRA